MSLDELFIHVDDFCIRFESWIKQPQLGQRAVKPGPKPLLAASEIMTILIYFHMSHYRKFKHYYLGHVHRYQRPGFPGLVSYTRFVALMPMVLPALCFYLWLKLGSVTWISFIDVTPIPVCHNRRIERHKVFDELAERGKTSMGWFYGFKLHLVVNDRGEIISFHLTPGNVDDRKPVPKLTEKLYGKLFADRGYISKDLFKFLFERGIQLITPIRKNK